MDSVMYDLIYAFCVGAFIFPGIIGGIIALASFITNKVKEHRRIKAKALERYVQYRINRYIHKGY